MWRTRPYVKFLSVESRQKLEDDLEKITYPESDYRNYLVAIGAIRDSIKTEFSDVARFVNDRLDYRDRFSSIKIVNLPVSKTVPMPPVDGGTLKHINKTSYMSENLLALISSMFGHPYSMFCEGQGLINNLIPSSPSSSELTGLGASSDLRLHIENAALRFLTGRDCSPTALFLTGVRQDKAPPYTRVSDARLALDLLGSDDKEVLASPEYKIRLPYRWRSYRTEYACITTKFVPLIEWVPRGLLVHAAFYGDMITDVRSKKAEDAAKRFEAALEEVASDEVVEPGEMLAIDNRISLHARTPFKASFDESGQAHRWVQRIFITDSIAHFDRWEEIDHGVFAPTFSAAA